MGDEISTGETVGRALGSSVGGAIAGAPGFVVGGELGGLVGSAYSQKPVAETFSTTLRNDLAPENVTLDAYQIYVRITTGHGSTTLDEANAAASELSATFAGPRADQIATARREAAEAWQGSASSAADAATAPLSDSFAVAQQQLAANAQALSTELAAWEHIRSQVEPVPETPPGGILNSANPFPTDVDAAINEYNAKAAKNIALYEAYSADTTSARSQVPQSYAQPAPLSASSAATTRTGTNIGAESVAPPQPGGAPEAGQPAGTGASAASGGGSPAPPSPGGASGMPGGTSGQGVAATDQTARPTPSTSGPTTSTPVLPARDTVGAGPLAGGPRPTGTTDTQRKLTGAGPGGGGGSGVGAFGGGVGGGAGARDINTRGTGTVGGPGMRGGTAVGTGPAPGQPAPGPAPGRGGVGTPGARGAAGMGGMPAGGAGRADGEEDQEHRRKYLIEPDDKELFGTDEQYVQPVIGDNR